MHHFLYFVIACTLLLQISCQCHLIDCREDGDFIKLKLMKDGHNALFGPDASINRDSIQFFNSISIGNDDFISYNESTETMDLFIEDGWEYILKIENIRTDTIIGATIVTSTDECGCSSYQLTKLTMNDQTVCVDGCDEIIEVLL